jgi:hypothetical protein
MNVKSTSAASKRIFTIFEWLPHYRREWLRCTTTRLRRDSTSSRVERGSCQVVRLNFARSGASGRARRPKRSDVSGWCR